MENLAQQCLFLKVKISQWFVLMLFCVTSSAYAQDDVAVLKTNAFQTGEEIKYKIKYGFITAGEAVLRVREADKLIAGNKTTHLVAEGKTTNAVKFLVKVTNRYDSYIDPKTLLPYLFTESVQEDNYHRDGYISFDRKNDRVVTAKKTEEVPEGTLDIISSLFYARSLDISKVNIGETINLKYYMEDGCYPLDVVYMGKEVIKTKLGKYECLKFSPSLLPGRVFRKDSRMYLWVSNDANRIPMRVEAEILIGSVYLDVVSAKGLKNETTAKVR